MKSTASPSEEYSEILSIDMSGNRRQFITVNVISAAIALAMLIPFIASYPFTFDIAPLMLNAAIILAGTVAYTALHELTHALFIIIFGCKKPSFGFSGLFAYTKADFYFSKFAYIVIALAPVVIFGIILPALAFALRDSVLPAVYTIAVINFSGAAGDLYVTARILPLPRDILVYDTGAAMHIYSKKHI